MSIRLFKAFSCLDGKKALTLFADFQHRNIFKQWQLKTDNEDKPQQSALPQDVSANLPYQHFSHATRGLHGGLAAY